MNSNDNTTLTEKGSVDEQANRWYVRLHSDDCTEEDIAEHKVWLEKSAANRKVYRELENLWNLIGGFRQKPEIAAYRAEALRSATELDVSATELDVDSAPRSASCDNAGKKTRMMWPRWAPVAAAASVLLVIFAVGFKNYKMTDDGIYRTKIGEQRTVTLNDGSIVIMDTQTTMSTDFSDEFRRIVLESGQARFNVGKDKNRPFVVAAGSGQITALGTEFVVRKDQDDVLVTLIEGQVAVRKEVFTPDMKAPSLPENSAGKVSGGGKGEELRLPANERRQMVRQQEDKSKKYAKTRPDNPFSNELYLAAGQQIAFNSEGLSKTMDVNLDRVTSWQEGRLVFENDTLAQVLHDLNRYSRSKILLGDDSLAEVRITGVFKTGDNVRIVQTLKTFFSMRVSSDRYGNLILTSTAKVPAG